MSSPSPAERAGQAVRLWRDEGGSGVARRLLERALKRVSPPGAVTGLVDRNDLMRVAELVKLGSAAPSPLPSAGPLTIAWVCFAPHPGSGGHTTMFRMVSALEQAGHDCIVYLRDDHAWSLGTHIRTIRQHWPAVRAEIRDLRAGIEDAHAIFATSWQTAYSVRAASARGARFYFVQDFERDFYPSGSEAMLAEATYAFGFHCVTAGPWLADVMRDRYGQDADFFDFGCDLERYTLRSMDPRRGVCCYFRPSTPRRGSELALMALDIFARRHPGVPIHLFAQPAPPLPFDAVAHGTLSPDALAGLYNSCVAGLVLSATNVSLVPYEMLACGCIPVVNDARHNRQVLANDHVAYAEPTPFGIAERLDSLVNRAESAIRIEAEAAARSVQGRSWADAGRRVVEVVERVVAQATTASVRD